MPRESAHNPGNAANSLAAERCIVVVWRPGGAKRPLYIRNPDRNDLHDCQRNIKENELQHELLRVHDRLIAFLELLPVPLHVPPIIQTQLEILREFKARRWACVFAKAAEHAARYIERILCQDFLTFCVTLPADLDTMFRASQRAEIARNAERLARIGIVVETRRAAETLRDLGPHFGILFGVIQGRALI